MNHRRSRSERSEIPSTFRSGNLNYKSVIEQLKKVYENMKTLESWRKTVLFVCVVTLAFDPLFFFIPVVDSHRYCSTLDKKLGVAICALRTFIDLFYVIHIIIYYCFPRLIAPRSQESLRGEIVEHSKPIRTRLLLLYFIVDVVSILPIPQVVVLNLFPRRQPTASLVSKEMLKWVMFCQYIPRTIRIYPTTKEVTRASGTVVETKWVGATLNLFVYLLPSHVIGAFWYLGAIERKDRCWREACTKIPGCNLANLYCAQGIGDNSRFLNTTCPLIELDQIKTSTTFNFGMYIEALKSRVVESRDFPRKFFYCFWWGLRNLSALGQNIETSNSIEEMIFAIIICVSGLLLFAVLIGNVQKYLQSTTIRVDEMEEKKRDTEKWMSYRMLPKKLKKRIRWYEDYKWRKTRGIEDEALLRSLPKDLRLETKHHLYLNRLKTVPFLNAMNDGWLLEALCDRVKYVFYSANSYILKKGDPVEEVLIVTRGNLKSMSQTSETTRDYGAYYLGAGDIIGGHLFWSLNPNPSSELPTSDRTVLTSTDIEGFILLPDDIKFLASHFSRFQFHINKLKHIFRFYSPHWRTWAACYIQAAWRKHCIRKLSKNFCAEQIPQATQSNLGTTLYVLRFVSKLFPKRRENTAACSSSPPVLGLVPQKPSDPEFSKDE